MNPEACTDFFKTPGEHVFQGLRFPGAFPPHILQRAVEFPFSNEDIIIDTYPKSGTTWLQEIVYLIVTRDFNAETTLNDRVPFLEVQLPGSIAEIDKLLSRDPPRIIKTHLPFRLLEHNLSNKDTKVVIGTRNIKDMLVSFFHFHKLHRGCGPFRGTWDEFFELFRHNRLTFGNWFDHVLGWWDQRHSRNIHFVMFEDLKGDLAGEVRKLAQYLGHHLTKDEIDRIVSATSFNVMKNNALVNKSEIKYYQDKPGGFMLRGLVGDWMSYFTQEQNAYVDELLREKLNGTDLKFIYEL